MAMPLLAFLKKAFSLLRLVATAAFLENAD